MRIKFNLNILAMMAAVCILVGCHSGKPETAAGPYSDEALARKFNMTPEQIREIGRYWKLTNQDMAGMSRKVIAKSLRKIHKPKPDHPKEAVKWRMESLVNENGVIPDGALVRAINHVKHMKPPANRRLWGHRPDEVKNTAGISRDKWEALGPGNIGGRLRTCVIHPTNPEKMWVGSVAGGIWVSHDAGSTWSVVDDFMTNLSVCTMIMDPTSNSNTMYAGTGEGYYNGDAIRGAGIFKTTDGGTTWDQLSATNNEEFYYVNRLAINKDSSAILAATRTGLYRSTDSGVTWDKVLTSQVTIGFLDVNFDPNDATKAVAASYGTSTYYSTDSGKTWTKATGLPDSSGRVEVAYAKSDSKIVYASCNYLGGVLYKSQDGGQTYEKAFQDDNTPLLASQGWYDNIVWVSPKNANIVIVGGVDLYRSKDGGSTFTKISRWQDAPDKSAHADHHYIVAHPDYDGSDNTKVYFCNDGGIYVTEDVLNVAETSGWQELNNQLSVTQFYAAAGDAASGHIVGGAQDNGTVFFTGNTESWVDIYGGDGGYCAYDTDDSNYLYGEYVYLTIFRNDHGGNVNSSSSICGINYELGTIKPEPYQIPDAINSAAEFIAPFILDPNDMNTMYAGGQSLWRTTDVKTANTDTTGPSWASVKSPTDSSSNITAIAMTKGSSDLIYVGHADGSIYRTTNGSNSSPTWSLVSSSLPARRCNRITIDPSNSDVVYAAFGGFSSDNLYKSSNGGSSWSDVTGSGSTGLPDAPIRGIAVYPGNSDWVYVGTEVGIFASEDGGTNWSTTNNGPTNCSVDELFWLDSTTLVSATHGRGIFKISVTGDTPTSKAMLATDVESITGQTSVGQNVESTSFNVWNSADTDSVSFSVTTDKSWVTCSPITGTSTSAEDKAKITVSFDTASLGKGNYSATITIEDPNAMNSPLTIPVTITITKNPFIKLTSEETSWSYDSESSKYSLDVGVEPGNNASSQSFVVYNATTDSSYALAFSVSEDEQWMSVSPASGHSSDPTDKVTATISYSTGSLPIGSYTGVLTVSDNNATNSPEYINVNLTVGPADEVSTVGLVTGLLGGNSQMVTRDMENRVSFWSDSSGNNTNAIQKNKRKQPVMFDTVSGPSVLFFDGKDHMVVDHSSSLPASTDYTKESIVISFRTGEDISSSQVLLDIGNAKQGINAYISQSLLHVGTWSFGDIAWGPTYVTGSVTQNTYHYLALTYNQEKNQVLVYLDSLKIGTINGIGNLSSSTEDIGLGGIEKKTYLPKKVKGRDFSGHLCDFLFYDRIISDSERNKIENYLKNKYTKTFANVNSFAVWLSSDSNTSVDNNTVKIWADRSQNLAQFKQNATTKRPRYSSTVKLSDTTSLDTPSVLFDGEEKYMTARSSDSINSEKNGYDVKVIALIFRTNDDVSSPQAIWCEGNQKAGLNVCIESGKLNMNVWNLKKINKIPAWGTATVSAPVEASSAYYALMVFDNSSRTLKGYLQDLTTGTGKSLMGSASVSGKIAKHNPASIGSVRTTTYNCGSGSRGNFFNGDLMEIIIYNNNLTDEDILELENYLLEKYSSD